MNWVRDDSFFRSEQPVACPLLGVSVSALIHTDGKPIHASQLEALARFLDIPADARGGLLKPLFADSREVREAVGEGPEIDGPEQVWEFVQWETILVPLQGPSGNRFVFVQGEPAWEEEHGVELLFRDERLVRLGRASGAFLSSCFWSWV